MNRLVGDLLVVECELGPPHRRGERDLAGLAVNQLKQLQSDSHLFLLFWDGKREEPMIREREGREARKYKGLSREKMEGITTKDEKEVNDEGKKEETRNRVRRFLPSTIYKKKVVQRS